jgi:hypothetical protein
MATPYDQEIYIDQKALSASISHALVTIKMIDPELVKAARKPMMEAAKIIANDAKSRIPNVPTGVHPRSGRPHWKKWSGSTGRDWDTGRVKSGIKGRYRSPRKDGKYERSIVSVIQSNAAGAIYDMAGKTGRYVQNPRIANGFIGAMSGTPSRTMWPAAEANMGAVLASIRMAQEQMEQTINDRLGGAGSSLAGF